MRLLDLEVLYNPKGRRYYVFFGLGYPKPEFRTKNKAVAFIRKFKRKIQDNVLIMNNLYGQLTQLKFQYDLYIDFEYQHPYKRFNEDFLSAYWQVYYGHKGEKKVPSQFNAIEASFKSLTELILILKTYTQRHKQRALLQH